MQQSNLAPAVERLGRRSAAAVVARARVASPGLNALLLSRLSAPPGEPGALLADPVFEAAKRWRTAPTNLGALAGGLLSPDLVAALDRAEDYRMPRDLRPWLHQYRAWQASLGEGKSVLVTSGTGSGKTECFLIPILNDILTNRRAGGGVKAILLYPLNALIESQRERLNAWARGLDGRVRFALYNGDTPETPRKAGVASSRWEVTNRRDLRADPPDILVTNITMLEYLLLREKDRALLEASQGALRWIVLDEAHSYVGSQAAEMALLLRRVRAAFGAAPQDVRLMATSATIGGEADAEIRLADFAAALAGQPRERIAVISGQEEIPDLGAAGPDAAPDPAALVGLPPEALWDRLAGNPRVQALRARMSQGPVSLSDVAGQLFDDPTRRRDAQTILDAAGQAARGVDRLLPWRAHLFHRAQGGVWACIDPACPLRGPELLADGAAWPFGAIHLVPQATCGCGAPMAEVTACRGCGTPHLRARLVPGVQPRLEAAMPGEADDYALDAEPEGAETAAGALIGSPAATGPRVWISANGTIFDNAPPSEGRSIAVTLFERADQRQCCADAADEALQDLRFGPAFFLGNALPQALEDLAEADGTRAGLPAGGRKAISFSDSRQGVARLAAKLQQDAERTLTRSFLYHAVQEGRAGGDPQRIGEIEQQIAALRAMGPAVTQGPLASVLAGLEAERDRLSGAAQPPLPWPELVRRFAEHHDLHSFAGEVWRPRAVGNRIWDKPEDLARTFLFRELFRRPRVQNNPETMGLLRLVFPELEWTIRGGTLPEPLRAAGADAAVGLALAAVDTVFRNALAVQIPEWMVPIVSPRFGRLNTIFPAMTPKEDRPKNSRLWPSALGTTGRMSLLVSHVYRLIDGDPGQPLHQDRADEVLSWLWSMLRRVCVDAGAGGLRLDFDKAAVTRMEDAWLCPLTRRPVGHTVGGRSPNDPAREVAALRYPRLPLARAAGLSGAERQELREWAERAPELQALRARGLWSDMHDRIAAFPAFVRSQEHSAQIPRAVLKTYEQKFNAGEINLLNCSTTMEMGVDLAAVRLVVNANVPPALSNYRQRVGRAGRRREPWAFGLTFCRDLPLDWQAFRSPAAFLQRPISAPKVWLDSTPLVQRHVNAALLSRWFAERGGMNIKADTGSFLGAVVDGPRPEIAEVDRFLADLAGDWAESEGIGALLADLVRGTILEGRSASALTGRAAQAMEQLVVRWRREFAELLARREGAEEEVAQALTLRARRMAGEFLLGDLARRGYTPAYGFPTDVVSFLPLGRREDDETDRLTHRARGASRELHQAIREYAPGSEIVIDGLVWQCEGVLPAWGAESDVSKLEDLRTLWECGTCHGFGVTSLDVPSTCPDCGALTLSSAKILRPAGFLTRKSPHTGYEALTHSPFVAPRISAAGAGWTALPDAAVGRFRHDPEGLVVTRASGKHGGGFAVCLDCGRAEPMERPQPGLDAPMPEAMRRHYPLARGNRTRLTADGFCPGGYTAPHRVQRAVHLAQSSRTDVFEMQLPAAPGQAAALAFAAALREALAEALGVESDEIGVAAGRTGAFAEAGSSKPVSIWLHDRAAGGAGLVARLREADVLAQMVERAALRLDCPDRCAAGCPACILQPDLSQDGVALDRAGALDLARSIAARLRLPEPLKVWGEQTRYLGQGLTDLIDSTRRSGALERLVVALHGAPSEWDLPGWPLGRRLDALNAAGVEVDLVVETAALTHAGFDLSVKLSLHRLGGKARLLHVGELPKAGGLPIAAWLRAPGGVWRAVALQAQTEALPGPDWAAGALGSAVIGPATRPEGQPISLTRLMELGTGTGHVLTPGGALDGPANGFGRRFWPWLGKSLPLEVQAMQAVGVARVAYTDRYLVTPITLLLLAEVLRDMPGAAKAAISIDLAPSDTHRRDGRAQDPWRLHDGYALDNQRKAVLQALLPRGEIRMAVHKGDLPHRRELAFSLLDGRRFRLLFDQGFGAWRAVGPDIRHDFLAEPSVQARRLLRLSASVRGESEPLVWDGGANTRGKT